MTETGAVEAAVQLVASYGLKAVEPRVLSASNNLVVHLAPAPLVAKIRRSEAPGDSRLGRELDVARYASERGAPVITPSTEPPAGPHRPAGYELTLWEHLTCIPREVGAGELGEAVRAFHAAVDDYPGGLPSLEATLEEVRGRLADESAMPLLPARDRAVLRRADTRIRAAITDFTWESRPLHGQPHTGNTLAKETGVVLLDFEDACRGPLEWDLAYLPGEAVAGFADARPDLVGLLRQAVSLCVAVWCWSDPGRAPEVAEAAHVHVRLLRDAESRV